MKRHILEYQLVSGQGGKTFNDEIAVLIAKGWQPFYGPTTCVSDNTITSIVQAMVKYNVPN